MGSILWFIIIGVVFYFLMQAGGCGAHGHGGHGGHGGHEDHGEDRGENHGGATGGWTAAGGWTARDPVCGMEGPVNMAPVTIEHQGKTYHFCSERCRDLFLANPDRYISQATEPSGGHHHGC